MYFCWISCAVYSTLGSDGPVSSGNVVLLSLCIVQYDGMVSTIFWSIFIFDFRGVKGFYTWWIFESLLAVDTGICLINWGMGGGGINVQ